jgi:hypothetical protein
MQKGKKIKDKSRMKIKINYFCNLRKILTNKVRKILTNKGTYLHTETKNFVMDVKGGWGAIKYRRCP